MVVLFNICPNMDKIEAHKFCVYHRDSLLVSQNCGCFYCLRIFPSNMVVDWCDSDKDDIGQTGLCSYCGIDSLICDADMAFDVHFLEEMYAYWF